MARKHSKPADGFKQFERKTRPQRGALVRLGDFYEIYDEADVDQLKDQGARCMDCGTPFCQSHAGCPIDNLIPEWNDLVYHQQWRGAYERLAKTNNFPEFTGRICPAPCEEACVLGITDPPVTIKSIECAIIDRAFAEGWVEPVAGVERTGKRIAVVGSGPAGLACADQLNKAGHAVVVFERSDRAGGLLMYGVPNMKLDKRVVQRRLDLLARSGIEFRLNTEVGEDVDGQGLRDAFDAVVLACGALKGRDLYNLAGRHLGGVHMAMDYLAQTTGALLAGEEAGEIDARGKHVIVIGGGDTGADCVGTALRQGCKGLLNITRREKEPRERDAFHPWPGPAGTYRVDYSHVEGMAKFGRDPREYGVLPLEFVGDERGQVRAVKVEQLEWERLSDGQMRRHHTGKTEELAADLVLVSIGFEGHDVPKLVEALGVESGGGAVDVTYGEFTTNTEGVFVAGDMRRGASLVVWAIAEGRGAARAVDEYLMGGSLLPGLGLEAMGG